MCLGTCETDTGKTDKRQTDLRTDRDRESERVRLKKRDAVAGAKNHKCWRNLQQRYTIVHILAHFPLGCFFPFMALLL